MPLVASASGICNVCRGYVGSEDVRSHGCADFYLDTSWNARVNPQNVAWTPGYRFSVEQRSKVISRTWRMKPRVYRVHFEIDQESSLRHTGGPKPTEATWEGVRALYARERPGSNGAPALGDDL